MATGTAIGSGAGKPSSMGTEDELKDLLSSQQFSVPAYLNLALSNYQPDVNNNNVDDAELLQRRMAELALQLQIQTQSCHEDIGRIGAELQAILPRCAADVGRLGVGLEGMRMDAQSLLDVTAQGDDQDRSLSTSLETLSTLHALQSNLQKTKEILTAAATWDSTINSVAPLLAEQNLVEAVNALSNLEQGERALRGMPHREERHDSIQEIRQQIQNLLQPQLKHALQNMNTRLAPLQQCVALYKKLDKMDSLKDDYVKQRPGTVTRAWFSYGPTTTTTDAGQVMEGDKSSSTGGITSSEAFMTWLPNWYESVLNLLQEERRQATSVFGPAEAPEVVVKVLREVFRPILPSFRGRLESVFPSNASQGSGIVIKGSFASIASIYESTLRFLSLAYEIVAGAFLDVVESGAGNFGDSGVGLYQDLRMVFSQVASPFSLYSEHFASLEGKHTSVEAGGVSKEMQQTVGAFSSSSGLDVLQESTSRLKDLAPFIFPILNGSLDRFELLDGGYGAQGFVSMMDGVLSSHLGELVMAVRSLSAALVGGSSRLAEDFDEQTVLCAMEMLKLAGSLRRDVQLFENGTRNRMKNLSQRMEDFIVQEREIQAPTPATTSSSFSFPDSLSVVEIDSFLTNSVCGKGIDLSNGIDSYPALVSLQRFGSSNIVPSTNDGTISSYGSSDIILDMLPKSNEAFKNLTGSCHSFVFDVCLAVPRKHLSGLSEMAAWKEGSSAGGIDSYGTLPQQYITQVGEHMLALVQALEPFASEPDDLSLANEVMNNVRGVALPYWTDFMGAAGNISQDMVIRELMDGKNITDLVLNSAALTDEDAKLEDGASDAEIASAAFCNAWLDAIGLAVTGILLQRIVRIPQLTPKGCEHLSADLNYLVNVFSALGVAGHPHPLVSHIASLAVLGEREMQSQLQMRNRSSDLERALLAVEERLALLRGVAMN